jgi:hypothetical protein
VLNPVVVAAFRDELEKIGARIPVMHGTSGAWKKIVVKGKSILRGDPNPRGVYVGTKRRSAKKAIEGFARSATKARGGKPTVSIGKVDTKKGWEAHGLTPWGKKNIGGTDDVKDLVDELDSGAKGERRGQIWRALQKGVGAWRNTTEGATFKPAKHLPVRGG